MRKTAAKKVNPTLKDVPGYKPTHSLYKELRTHEVDTHTFSFSIELTPKLAKYILAEFNDVNRRLNLANIAKILRDIVSGNWKFTGQPLIFDNLGNMRNGQHTCTACVDSGVTIRVLVVWGVEDEAFAAIGDEKKRTPGEWLAYKGFKDASLLSAVIKQYSKFEAGGWEGLARHSAMSVSAVYVKAVLDANPWLGASLDTTPLGPRVKGYPRALLNLFHAMLLNQTGAGHREQVTDFFKSLRGPNRTVGQPANAYVMRIENDYDRKRKRSSHEEYSILVKSWNAFVAGRTVLTCSWMKKEGLPLPIVVR